MEQEELYGLMRRYLSGNATAEEKKLLNDWYYQSFGDEDYIAKIAAEPDESESVLEAKMWARLKEAIAHHRVTMGTVKSRPRLLSYAVAAAVLLLVGVSGFYFFNKQVKARVAVRSEKLRDDPKPGSNKAILTLGNGSRIYLDTASAGTVASQHGARIVKPERAAGLVYQLTPQDESPKTVEYNTLSTPRGGQYQLSLPDGSLVWLNAASSLRYPTVFGGNERVVELEGEAYFEVAHNSAMPFKVRIDNRAEVVVLGTHFNVNAYKDEPAICTTLIEGRINFLNGAGGQPVALTAGQQVQLNNSGNLKLTKNADLEEAVAWKNGMFEFNGNNIELIMRQIARWYDVEIVYDGDMTDENFTGQISRYANVSQVIKMLEYTKDLHFRIEGRKITVAR